MFNRFLLATVSLLTASCIFATTAKAESKQREQQLPTDRHQVWPTPVPTQNTRRRAGEDQKTYFDRIIGKSPLEWPSNEDYCRIDFLSYNPCLREEQQRQYNRSRSQESSGSQ
ncbi:hypothetical protein H6G97_31445 [Nostoc flagelliforme FACHB-838]|uniref:Uncharacterized protein n=1 Tax=Nostoc flagelliforme FACHB-838 TaxID=2692904 RepID=A0ABR8DXE8_9NOSO|nr:hypothetical protein [Nostoc flagelliforme]MBD2533823.1 hypothetical protein [Nostoc flagelliforme FACHB-838]